MNIKIEKTELRSIGEDLKKQFGEILYDQLCKSRDPFEQDPPEILYERTIKYDDPSGEEHWFLAFDEDKLVGFTSIWIKKVTDRHLLWTNTYVKPEYRRKGIAKQLFRAVLDFIPSHITKISFDVRREQKDHPNYMEDLFESIGAKMVYINQTNASDIRDFDLSDIEQLAQIHLEKAKSKGYDIYEAEDLDFGDKLSLETYVPVLEEIWNDMPREDGDWEDEKLSVERFLSFYKNNKYFGDKVWTYVAVHRETGEIAGLTETRLYTSRPTVADQYDTGVVRQHRGNGLGLALKYQMLSKLLTNPKSKLVQYWSTGNANSNKHMLNINRKLGYKTYYYHYDYEIEREALLAYLNR